MIEDRGLVRNRANKTDPTWDEFRKGKTDRRLSEWLHFYASRPPLSSSSSSNNNDDDGKTTSTWPKRRNHLTVTNMPYFDMDKIKLTLTILPDDCDWLLLVIEKGDAS